MLYLKLFGVWVILAISAIVIATFRNGVLRPPFGEQTAHQLGTVMFLVVQFIIIFYFIKKLKVKDVKALLRIGLFWITLTMLFEFCFGHYVIGHPWEKLLADYNLIKGRLWVIVLVNNIAAPIISGKKMNG